MGFLSITEIPQMSTHNKCVSIKIIKIKNVKIIIFSTQNVSGIYC